YSYDEVGNRLSRISTVSAITTQQNISVDDNDRLTTDSYDNNGSTVEANGVVYTYDFENRIIRAEGNGKVITIKYDGDGNRVEKSVTENGESRTTKYLVDTNNLTGYAQVVEEIEDEVVVKQYSYGLDLISQRQLINNAYEVSFYGYDGHGSVRFLTDSTGTITDTYDYDAFGNIINQTGNTANNYLYAGEQWDSDLGLYYNRARYLDVNRGRFFTMDEIEGVRLLPSSLHKYLYVSANPINKLDPTGNAEATIAGTSAGVIGANILARISTHLLSAAIAAVAVCSSVYLGSSISQSVATYYKTGGTGGKGGIGRTGNPCDGNRPNSMRVQLQRDTQNDDHIHSEAREAPQNPGVTVAQMQLALEVLFYVGRDLIPSYLESDFLTAIGKSSNRYRAYPPGGVTLGGNFVRFTFDDRNIEYRVDTENTYGHNFKQ
ncbi:MAG: RHS repeat-associated core domain-containing protein, partial [Blastocatellia bacterium]|nr:RHS repeat-associated core domain-containing protein [Blastocatellia bacterium]